MSSTKNCAHCDAPVTVDGLGSACFESFEGVKRFFCTDAHRKAHIDTEAGAASAQSGFGDEYLFPPILDGGTLVIKHHSNGVFTHTERLALAR